MATAYGDMISSHVALVAACRLRSGGSAPLSRCSRRYHNRRWRSALRAAITAYTGRLSPLAAQSCWTRSRCLPGWWCQQTRGRLLLIRRQVQYGMGAGIAVVTGSSSLGIGFFSSSPSASGPVAVAAAPGPRSSRHRIIILALGRVSCCRRRGFHARMNCTAIPLLRAMQMQCITQNPRWCT